MTRVPQKARFRIINMSCTGFPQREIAASTRRSTQTVNRIIQAWRHEGRLHDQSHLTRPRSTMEEAGGLIIVSSIVDPLETPGEISDALGLLVSARLISRRLVKAGTHSWIAAQKPLLTKIARLHDSPLLNPTSNGRWTLGPTRFPATSQPSVPA